RLPRMFASFRGAAQLAEARHRQPVGTPCAKTLADLTTLTGIRRRRRHMPRRFGILALAGALFLVTGNARAQGQAGMQETERPATSTIYGDTGLWFVPAGEVLKDKDWSLSAYRINWDVRQG